ncbi:MAG: lipocalin-like domain-containing protein [Chloroflexota bacterium]
MRLVITVVLLLILSGIAIVGFSSIQADSQTNLTATVIDTRGAAADTEGFERAFDVRPITFPEDLGSHPTFQTEWWYYTGNLADQNGNRFGFQLTFFRRALEPEKAERASDWGSNQLYFAHFGLTDVANNTFYSRERWSRGGADLAGAQSPPYRVWLEDWEARELESGAVQLIAHDDDITLDLVLELDKPHVLQGQDGLSPKSDEPGNSSYYYSFTRQNATGTIITPDGTVTVSGTAWKDHEWSTSALGPNAVGWDWFALQLDDQRELMFFQIRKKDGSLDFASEGVLVMADGQSQKIHLDDIKLTVLDHWVSPRSEGRYPAQWQLIIPDLEIDLTITPLIPDQEMSVSTVYWEGAVRVEGSQTGFGYVEMTGYAGTLQGRM